MLHPFDAIKNPVHSRHPVYKIYKKLYRHTNRYTVGDDIVIICFYHYVGRNKSYNDINYYVNRCLNKTISRKDILFESYTLNVISKFNCYFKMEGYRGVLKNDPFSRFINSVPHISVYHSSFPKVYFEWKLDKVNNGRSFIDIKYAFELAKASSNRFKKVMFDIKNSKRLI